MDRVFALIRSGQFKRAAEAAKDLHRQSASPGSERVLAEAYVARIFSFEPHMAVEAEALFRLAAERCPSARGIIEAIRPRLAVRFGRLDEAVRPLAGEDAPEEAREAAEDALRRELTDLAALAACTTLPETHPLRRAAAEIDVIFKAVTSGPAREEDLGLPQVSRRSPLAAWKPLLRSIAAFYRGDDAACQAHLALIDAGSAPARVVPALRALLAAAAADGGSGAEPRSGVSPRDPSAGIHFRREPPDGGLVEKIGGGGRPLRVELARLDDAYARGKPPEILRAVKDAVGECRRRRPDLVERLRQRIAIRCMMADLSVERVRSAMGGPAVRDAAFFRLFAVAGEKKHNPVAAAMAWSAFCDHSVREGAFAEDGPEATAVRLRVLDLIERLPLEDLEGHAAPEEGPAGAGAAARGEALDAGLLFERVAAADPRPEVFERWLAWARRNGRGADEVALAWKRASPADARPLILLAEMAERRGALKKALAFLGQAESLDRLNPLVAEARFRLTSAMALKHLEQRQSRLGAKDLAVLEALPQARLGRRPAFVAALRHLLSRQVQDGHPERARTEVVSILGGEREAFFLLAAIERAVGHGLGNQQALPGGSPLELVTALATALVLCEDVGVPFTLPAPWEKKLLGGLAGDAALLPDDAGLRAVADCALRSGLARLAHAASGAGLRRGASPGRFLLLRARSLPARTPRRRTECLEAATALAVRARDTALIAEIRDVIPWHGGAATGDDGLKQEDIDRIVAREAAADDASPDILPPPGTGAPRCAFCGRHHGDPAEDDAMAVGADALDEDDDDLDHDELAEDLMDEILGSARSLPRGRGSVPRLPPELAELPPKLLALFLEMLSRFGDLPDPEELARLDPALHARFSRAIDEQLMKGGALPGMGRHGRRPKRRRRR